MHRKAIVGLSLGAVLGVSLGLSLAFAQASTPTSAFAISGPQRQAMGVPFVAPLWPDATNPTGALYLTCDSGCAWYPPAQVRVEVRLRTGSKWYAKTGPKVVLEKGQHARVTQR